MAHPIIMVASIPITVDTPSVITMTTIIGHAFAAPIVAAGPAAARTAPASVGGVMAAATMSVA